MMEEGVRWVLSQCELSTQVVKIPPKKGKLIKNLEIAHHDTQVT